jgi:hypothetical protein
MTTARARRRRTIDLAAYGDELDAFSAEIGDEFYAGLAGIRDEMALAPIYERHAGLFDRPAIDGLQRLGAGDGEDARQARRLWGFAAEAYVERAVVDLTERIATAEATAGIMWRGERIGYRAAAARIAQLSDRGERNALETGYLEAVEAINPLRLERLLRMRAATAELGFGDAVEMAAAVHGFDPDALAGELQAFIAASETPYYAALRRYLAEIDVEAGDGSVADLGYLMRGSSWDAWFEARRLLPIATETLGRLGMDVAAQPNVTLDVEQRPNKSPRAFCVPVRVPEDVRLVVQPRGGHDDYVAMLHELGHVEHFAHAASDLPAADRHVGDTSVTEGYAFVLGSLATEPAWLAEHLRMPPEEIAGYGDFAAFVKLFMLRRYTAKLLYELRLHRDPDPAIGRAYYAGLLGLLTGVHTAEARWLSDVDDHLYAARYLRAWMLEGSIVAHLRTVHGPGWWQSPSAGQELIGLWREGQRPSGEDVLARVGYDAFDWRPVLLQIRERLIGELSGYGGPNITTRAGTRKV